MSKLPMIFPTELERVRRQVEDEQLLTPNERLNLVCEMLDFARTLNPDQDVFGYDDPIWSRHEADWQRRMRDVFQRRSGPNE